MIFQQVEVILLALPVFWIKSTHRETTPRHACLREPEIQAYRSSSSGPYQSLHFVQTDSTLLMAMQ